MLNVCTHSNIVKQSSLCRSNKNACVSMQDKVFSDRSPVRATFLRLASSSISSVLFRVLHLAMCWNSSRRFTVNLQDIAQVEKEPDDCSRKLGQFYIPSCDLGSSQRNCQDPCAGACTEAH